MEKTDNYRSSIIEIVELVSNHFLDDDDENEIGLYEEHFITERMTYLVRLSDNDSLEIPIEAAQDYAKIDQLLPDQMESIIKSYRKSN